MCPGLVCDSVRGVCVECGMDLDCAVGQRCQSGVCGAPPASCRSDRDCTAEGLVCDMARGECAECNAEPDCDVARFCDATHTCAIDTCIPDETTCVAGGVAVCAANGSAFESPAACPAGSGCRAGACVADVCAADATCDDGAFCNGPERCMPSAGTADSRGCVAGAAPCPTGTICVAPEMRCATDCAVGGDADSDTHPATACGGDDCDDTNAAVHPGAPELCNSVDDNCDTRVDELPAASATCAVGEVCRSGACGGRPRVVALGVGVYTSYAVLDDGSAWAWGSNRAGGLGDGTLVNRTTAVRVTGLVDALDVRGGTFFACALRSGGGMKCWGSDSQGTLGDGVAGPDSPVPTDVVDLTDAVAFGVAPRHVCAVRSGGDLVCWGACGGGRCGAAAALVQARPISAGVAMSVEAGGGGNYSCARRASGEMWGFGMEAPTGFSTPGTLAPMPIPMITADGLTAGPGHVCVRHIGQVTCWGFGVGTGQLVGPGSPFFFDVPGITDAIDLSSGSNFTCALRATGHVQCWGVNDFSQLGHAGGTSLTPTDVGTLSDVVALAHGSAESHMCALRATGAVVCWGANMYGELGDGSATGTSSATPVTVIGLP